MESHEFEFELGSEVKIRRSGEGGQVIGRAQYLDGGNQYQVAMTDVHGAYKECWIAQGQLEQAVN